MVTIHRSVADTILFSFLRQLGLQTILAGAILASAAGVAQAQTAAPAAEPLRISIEVDRGSYGTLNDFQVGTIVTGVKNGLSRGMPRGAVKVVDRDEPSDLLVKVSCRTITLPGRKPTGAPMVLLDAFTTVIDGRELVARHSQLSQWEFTARSLGADVAVILKLRTAVVSSVASDVPQLDALIQSLSTRDAVERARTAARVAALGPAGIKATSALIELLGDKRALRIVGPGTATTVADEAAKALISIGASSALADVLKSNRVGHKK